MYFDQIPFNGHSLISTDLPKKLKNELNYSITTGNGWSTK